MLHYIAGAVLMDRIFLINDFIPQGLVVLLKSVKPPRQKTFIQNTDLKNAQISIFLRDTYSRRLSLTACSLTVMCHAIGIEPRLCPLL
jgi:hypothetical protein